MDRYLIKIKNSEFIIPKENIVMLALMKAMDNKVSGIPLKTNEQAVGFLESLGMKISEESDESK